MLQIQQGGAAKNCQGMTRRTALKAGVLGLMGLTQADMLKARADAPSNSEATRHKSVILMWLDGGPSQLETYDPKPDASSEYRGPYGVTRTNVPGIIISDILPGHAQHMDKMVLLRSMHHDTGDHFAGAHCMLTGRFGSNSFNLTQRYPSMGSFAARVLGANQPGLPAYVGLPSAQSVYLFPGYMGAAYLGAAYNPFEVDRDARYLAANSQIRIGMPRMMQAMDAAQSSRLRERMNLLQAFDTARREVDNSGTIDTLDRYQQQAADIILGARARAAFDIDREPSRVAERYGPGPWGRYTLMARRLVEAGVTFVTVDMPHWDDHSNIKDGHGYKLPPVDRAVTALLEDLSARGMLDDVLLIVMGEFGRTPRINDGQPGIPIPGRDHWGQAFSVMLAGGGLRTGQVVGATNARAEHPVSRALVPGDLCATVYRWLGIDPKLTFRDYSGRPQYLVEQGEAIEEVF